MLVSGVLFNGVMLCYMVPPAVKMCRVEVEVVGVKEELAVRRLQIVRLQSRLRDAEKILVGGCGFRVDCVSRLLFSGGWSIQRSAKAPSNRADRER